MAKASVPLYVQGWWGGGSTTLYTYNCTRGPELVALFLWHFITGQNDKQSGVASKKIPMQITTLEGGRVL